MSCIILYTRRPALSSTTVYKEKIIMKKIWKCGIIGLSMGIFHLDAVLNNGAEIGAICDVNEETLKKVGDSTTFPRRSALPIGRRWLLWRSLILFRS